jgi:hypothetical protein
VLDSSNAGWLWDDGVNVGTYRSADRGLAISSRPATSIYKAMKLDRTNDLLGWFIHRDTS